MSTDRDRHCEERSDEAIHLLVDESKMDRHAAKRRLAMTGDYLGRLVEDYRKFFGSFFQKRTFFLRLLPVLLGAIEAL